MQSNFIYVSPKTDFEVSVYTIKNRLYVFHTYSVETRWHTTICKFDKDGMSTVQKTFSDTSLEISKERALKYIVDLHRLVRTAIEQYEDFQL